MKRLMRLSEVALVLNVHIRTVYRMVTDASLMALQIRGSWRVDPSDLQSYITRQKQQFAEDYGCIQDYSSLV
ncbi:MAG: helix-turn-helix domain-containing protein [Deltaproteobacteria bacterium]